VSEPLVQLGILSMLAYPSFLLQLSAISNRKKERKKEKKVKFWQHIAFPFLARDLF